MKIFDADDSDAKKVLVWEWHWKKSKCQYCKKTIAIQLTRNTFQQMKEVNTEYVIGDVKIMFPTGQSPAPSRGWAKNQVEYLPLLSTPWTHRT